MVHILKQSYFGGHDAVFHFTTKLFLVFLVADINVRSLQSGRLLEAVSNMGYCYILRTFLSKKPQKYVEYVILWCPLTLTVYGPVVNVDSEESDLALFDRFKAAEVKSVFFFFLLAQIQLIETLCRLSPK